ncbi:hypothetical protein B4134_2746 [Bacillus safensis]|nr:hypothetical protein B4134_2746 [Bacillus safensis]
MCNDYKNALINELNKHHETFRKKDIPKNVDIVLILLPFEHKKVLVEKLHQKLKVWQQL